MGSEKSKGLIVQSNGHGIPRSGCYVVDAAKQAEGRDVAVPLKHLDYQVDIVNSIARVVLEQVYVNPTDKFLELEYSVPIDPKVCIYKFNAAFGDTHIEGVVKEREQANKEYEKAIK